MDKQLVLYAFPLLLASLWSMAAHSAPPPQNACMQHPCRSGLAREQCICVVPPVRGQARSYGNTAGLTVLYTG